MYNEGTIKMKGEKFMHTYETEHGWIFHHNGDYSGDIIISPPCQPEFRVDSVALMEFSRRMFYDIITYEIERLDR